MSAPEDGCKSITCPEDPEDMYFPNPSDPGSFCQCTNGVPYYQPCPTGLHFNPELKVCDYPDNAAAARARMGLT